MKSEHCWLDLLWLLTPHHPVVPYKLNAMARGSVGAVSPTPHPHCPLQSVANDIDSSFNSVQPTFMERQAVCLVGLGMFWMVHSEKCVL